MSDLISNQLADVYEGIISLDLIIETEFANIETAKWLDILSGLYQIDLRGQPLEIRRVYALLGLSRDWSDTHPKFAFECCERALRLSLELEFAVGSAWYWREYGGVLQQTGELDQAIVALQKSVAAFLELDIRAGVASSTNILGHIAVTRGHHQMALLHYWQYVQIARELGRIQSEAVGSGNIAETQLDLGNPWQALETLLESRRVLQLMDVKANAIGWLTGLIGRAYFELGQPHLAIACLRESLEILKDIKDFNFMAITLGYLSDALEHMGDFDGSLRALNEALEVNHEYGDPYQKAALLTRLSALQDDPGQARLTAQEALGLAKQLVAPQIEVAALLQLAMLVPDQNIVLLEQALQIALGLGAKQLVLAARNALSLAHESRSNHDLALVELRAAGQLESEMRHEETTHRIHHLSLLFDLSQAERLAKTEREQREELERINLESTQLVGVLQVQTKQLQVLASEDSLTGLANRRTLERCLPREYKRAKRHKYPMSIVFADIDHFKVVNDCFGHAVGDLVLKTIADFMLRACRKADLVVRFGGEEFVLLLPETSLEQALLLCEQLRTRIAEYDWSSLRAGLQITMSFGVNSNLNLADAAQMLETADLRLYEAKQSGRNKVIGF